MRILVTGSAGHLGEALMRSLRASAHEAIGIDIAASPYTDAVGSIVDPDFVDRHMHGVRAVLHTATLHKPHVATHTRQDFVDINVTGTLNLLEAATRHGIEAFVYTSTTSAFGDALVPPPGAPAAWITEDTVPVPKNIYGVTKSAAEDLCRLFHRNQKLPCVVLRTSRFFPEPDDSDAARAAFLDANLKANELLYRRVDLQDVVDAHLLAIDRAGEIGFGRFIISATTPFVREDLADLRRDAPAVVARHFLEYAAEYARHGWRMTRRSIGSTSTPPLATRSAGRRSTISPTCSPACAKTATHAARWRAPWVPRAITPRPSPACRIRSRADKHGRGEACGDLCGACRSFAAIRFYSRSFAPPEAA